MATVETESDAGVATLMRGIVDDARRLIIEQLKLFRIEIQNDVRQTLMGIIPIVIGGLMAFVGLLLLGMTSAYLLCWAMPQLPLWGGFGIVSAVILAVSLGLVFWGVSKIRSVVEAPHLAVQELKENLQWKTNK